MKEFISDLGVIPSASGPMKIFCDNTGAIALAKESRIHKKTVRTGFSGYHFPENGPCAHQPQDYCQLARNQLDIETPSKIHNMQHKTILAYNYNTRFLVVDGESGLCSFSVYGTPFPIGTADLGNSYLREAAITIAQVPGPSSQCSSPCNKSGQDNSQGQASEYFECTRKHYEHRYNISDDNHAQKYSMITTLVTKYDP